MKTQLQKFFAVLAMILCNEISYSQSTLISQFDFNNNLNDKFSLSTCTSTNNASTAYVNGAFTWTSSIVNGGGGLVLTVPDASFTENDYSISMDISFSKVFNYAKIIDFANTTADAGLYFQNFNLELYPIGNGTIAINANTFYTVLLTRNGSDDTTNTYIIQGNTLIFQVKTKDIALDQVTSLVGTDRVFHLFHDDVTTNSEYTDTGSVRSVRIWNGVVNINQVCNSIVSLTTTPSTSICAGGSFTIAADGSPTAFTTYTFVPPNTITNSIVITPSITLTETVFGDYYSTGCQTPSVNVILTVNPNPTITAVSSTSLLCAGQTATLTASGASTYTWNTGPNSSVIAVSPTLTTSYTVTGTSTASCIGSVVITQSVSTCTGLHENSILNSGLISIYPNPGNGEFTLNLNSITENTYVEIYNSLGQLILNEKINDVTHKIILNNNQAGIYIAKIMNSGIITHYFKIIKQ